MALGPTESGYSRSHMGKGQEYARAFSDRPWRALMWELEKRALDDLVRRRFPGGGIDLLDLACGTGRVLSFLERRAARAVGVDISPTMLEVARRTTHAEIVLGDVTRDDLLADSSFHLITAFRFFPNAEPELRAAAMATARRLLARGGRLVFNNHRNTASLMHRLARILQRGGREGMAPREVRSLVDTAGFEVETTYHVGFLPITEKRAIRPWFLVRCVERAAFVLPLPASLYQDVVYVCRVRDDADVGSASRPTEGPRSHET